jgi:hypothetical protein
MRSVKASANSEAELSLRPPYSGSAAQLSHRLLTISHMVEDHPELHDRYQVWRRLYAAFTADRDDGVE